MYKSQTRFKEQHGSLDPLFNSLFRIETAAEAAFRKPREKKVKMICDPQKECGAASGQYLNGTSLFLFFPFYIYPLDSFCTPKLIFRDW